MLRKPINYEGRLTGYNGESNTCTARRYKRYLDQKKISGYFLDKQTIRHREQGQNVEYKRNLSNIYYILNRNFLRKYINIPVYQAIYQLNCIIRAYKKHYNLKIRHSYIPTQKQQYKRIIKKKETLDKDEQLKDQTLQLRGCQRSLVIKCLNVIYIKRRPTDRDDTQQTTLYVLKDKKLQR